MRQTEINLTSEQLSNSIDAFYNAFEEYFTVLNALLAFEGCADGGPFVQRWAINCPEIMRVKDVEYLRADKGRLVNLAKLGINVSDLIKWMPITIKYPFNPTRYSFGLMLGFPIFHLIKTTDGQIVEVRELSPTIGYKTASPRGFTLDVHIIISPSSYSFWEYHFRRIVDFYLAPIEPFMTEPLELPSEILGGIHIPNGHYIRFNDMRGFDAVPRIPDNQFLTHEDILVVLNEYREQVDRSLTLARREVQRQRIVENQAHSKKIVVVPQLHGHDHHPSEFERPSVATKISTIAEAMKWGKSESTTSKMNRYIKDNPGFACYATPFGFPRGYYWINLDHPLAPQFPVDPIAETTRKKKIIPQ